MPRKRWCASPNRHLFHDDFILPDVSDNREWYKSKLHLRCTRYFQTLNIITIFYSSLFLYFIIGQERYLFIRDISFLLLPISHFILELFKFMGYQRLRYQRIYLSKIHFINFLPTYLSAIVMYHVMFVLFGADFIENIYVTFMFSCYLTILTLTPLYFHCGSNSVFLIGLLEDPEDQFHRSFWYTSLGAMCGAWFGAFVIPLDWNRPWQLWPIPNVIGSIIGFIVGHLYSCFFLFKYSSSSTIKL